MPICKLVNPFQRYAWGSRDGISDALGIPNPGGGPLAEIWMGAHPSAPSSIILEGKAISLDAFIREDPKLILGDGTVARFGDSLPFLMKALSAGTPLSIQAHPGKRKAERGFDRENLAGIPLDGSERNYRDANHKPEMSVALTRLQLLCGFRPIDEIIENIHLVAPREHQRILGRLERSKGRVELSVFFYTFISAPEATRRNMLALARSRIHHSFDDGSIPSGRMEIFQWVLRLMDIFPGDMGALTPLILNLVTLEPGEGVFIAPGELHAYLAGTCLEVMANSDNVIRGALTKKYVDLPELVSVLSFIPERAEPVLPRPVAPCEEAWPVFVPDFQVSRIEIGDDRTFERTTRGPEILLCSKGRATIHYPKGKSLSLDWGESAFVSADETDYRIDALESAVIHKATVADLP